jgi:methionine synthase II (cobalamin-independent)
VIALQEGTGVEVVTDGEMRRYLFMGPITETVEGIEPVPEGTTGRSRSACPPSACSPRAST